VHATTHFVLSVHNCCFPSQRAHCRALSFQAVQNSTVAIVLLLHLQVNKLSDGLDLDEVTCVELLAYAHEMVSVT
jgi:hypothetical protein